MEFLDLIDQLEELVETGRRVPGTGRSMVDRDQVAILIDQLRASVPQEIQEAYEIRARGEAIVSEAVLVAKKIRTTAEQEHRTRIENSSIVQDAEERAEGIRLEAERDAQRVRQKADQEAAARIQESDHYAETSLQRLKLHLQGVRERLAALEAELNELERAVEAGMRYLQARWGGMAQNGNGNGHSNGNGHANGNGNGLAHANGNGNGRNGNGKVAVH
jgi:hypothetical protein